MVSIAGSNFSLTDVASVLYNGNIIGHDLLSMFSDASGTFDPSHQPNATGSKNNLQNFGGYINLVMSISSIQKISPTSWKTTVTFKCFSSGVNVQMGVCYNNTGGPTTADNLIQINSATGPLNVSYVDLNITPTVVLSGTIFVKAYMIVDGDPFYVNSVWQI
jgi:hypothetical protein